MPVNVSRNAIVTSPGWPSPTVNSPSACLTVDTGVITAAVPQANTSVISPAAVFFCHSSTSILRSSMANPASVANCSNESRVMPGSSDPDSSGVTSRADPPLPNTKNRFMPPISSM
ncbi:hypothetical protein C1Y40_05568 [Mycobacterium talmoniae]|uniref:Uncharacterized protein n=1 Tax=Mycobacterium talmoniae TaxID=1858794 RepID=A0A2S8BC99_9MYCO|nr:hypothetical protein C1Y40_05568 [Mycobacterium talmoniae]